MHNHNFFGNGFLGNELTQHNPVLAFFEFRHVADMFLLSGDYFFGDFAGWFRCLRGNQRFDGVHDAGMI